MNRLNRALILAGLTWASTACTHYSAINGPPPGHTAQLNDAADELRISPGVALAFTCTTPGGNPCSSSARIEDPSLAKLMPGHLAELDSYVDGRLPQSSYVVVGLEPGKTRLLIDDEDPIDVIVEER
ncbi:MAG: hypothetical protein KC766_16655 [Myxococcales bacterium]|nr:hypothetical protein [Myxococcales bacterium]